MMKKFTCNEICGIDCTLTVDNFEDTNGEWPKSCIFGGNKCNWQEDEEEEE